MTFPGTIVASSHLSQRNLASGCLKPRLSSNPLPAWASTLIFPDLTFYSTQLLSPRARHISQKQGISPNLTNFPISDLPFEAKIILKPGSPYWLGKTDSTSAVAWETVLCLKMFLFWKTADEFLRCDIYGAVQQNFISVAVRYVGNFVHYADANC